MAATTSFKQQCPSCEAMVPIRDPNLIGKKIDCPKCKYRFVVENPDASGDPEDEAPAKKGKAGKNGVAAKGKKGRIDADGEDRPRPAKKKQGTSPMLYVGIGLALLALGAAGVGGYFLIKGGDKDKKPANSGNPGGRTSPGGSGEPDKKEDEGAPKDAAAAALGDPTNLLPNDTQAVINVNFDKLRKTSLNAAAFRPGSFNDAAFHRTFGFPIDGVARVVMGLNNSNHWIFTVVRTADATKINPQALTGNLRLEAQPPINKLNYYLVGADLDGLSNLLLKANQPRNPLALYVVDPNTLVFADLLPMQEFLKNGAKQNFISQPEAPPPAAGEENPGAVPGMGPSMGPSMGMRGGPPPGFGPTGPATGPGGPGGDGRRGLPGGSSGSSTSGAQGGEGGPGPRRGGKLGGLGGAGLPDPAAAGAGGPPGVGGPAMGMRGGPGMGGLQNFPGVQPPKQQGSPSYLTVAKELKALLDQIEETKDSQDPLVVSVAFDVPACLSGADVQQARDYLTNLIANEEIGKVFPAVATALTSAAHYAGFGIQALSEGHVTGVVAADLKNDIEAKSLRTALQASATAAATVLRKNADLDLTVGEASNPAPNTGGFGPGAFGPGGFGMIGGVPQPGGPPAGATMPAGFMGARGGVPGGDLRGPGPGGFGARPGGVGVDGGPGLGDGKEDEKPAGKDGTVTVSQRDKTVLVNADINLKNPHYQVVVKAAETIMIRLKGDADMINPRSRVHELAAATQAYLAANGHFPRGTIKRAPGDRGIDWRPDQRLSWMVEVLPYLADGEYKDLPRDPEKAWNEEPNGSSAEVLIPQFLDRAKPATTYRVRYPSRTETVAATHWVGIAGVGRDAAEYKAGNPAVAKKLGVFGYDRETKKDDVKDGLDKTILLIEVPTDHKSPWLLGGGATVRGVSDEGDKDNPLEPFVCAEYQGKKGTFAIMCDGKVRFLPADLPAATFRALCTIAGGETIEDLDKLCPVVPAPEVVQPPAEAAPPPAPAGDAKGVTELEGDWKLVRLQGFEQVISAEEAQGGSLTVKGDSYTLVLYGVTEKGTIKTNPSVNPKQVDFTVSEGKNTGNVHLGIYALEGGQLRMMASLVGMPRPADFNAEGANLIFSPNTKDDSNPAQPKTNSGSGNQEVKAKDASQKARDAASQTAMAAMSRTCAQCHTGPRAKGDTMLFTGPNQMNKDAPWDKIKQAVAEGKMPPKQARNKLAPEDAKAIVTWIGG